MTQATELRAYNNDPKVKAKYVKRVKMHHDADEIIQGTYWENGKGCAVGCTIEGNQHSRYETELGIPHMIARLEDRIFEGLSNKEAKEFPLKFLKAIKPGADLSMVVPKFFVWLLIDPEDGVIKFARTDGKKAIQKVAELYLQKIAGKRVTERQWLDAYADAAAAAADAADAAYAAYAAAAYAAYAAAAAAARKGFYTKMANKLVELLKVAVTNYSKCKGKTT